MKRRTRASRSTACRRTLEPDLADYYRRNDRWPGAFVIAVNSYEEFAAAVRTKLITEIAGEGSGEHAVDVGLDEVRRGGRRGLLGRHVVDHT